MKLYAPEEKIGKPSPACLYLILSYESEEIYFKIKEALEEKFSKIRFESVSLPKWILNESERILFTAGNQTKILTFDQLIHREELPAIYKEILDLGKKARKQDTMVRMIPGYLTLHNIILGSLQDDFHRIYLYHGVFAEIIYKYERSLLIVEETAPSFFRSKEVIYFFTNLRESFEYEYSRKM
jgi:hypothetical protein